MNEFNWITCLIIVTILGAFLFYREIQARRLKEYLLKYGVEVEAETRIIVYGRLFEIIQVNFQINGQIVKKILTASRYDWFPLAQPNRDTIKKFPLVVDPLNPKRFLFNMHKFQLEKTSDDSVNNFLERNRAEHPDAYKTDSE